MKTSDFYKGLLWNYGSIIILAIGGFAFSFLIIGFYDSKTLGIFNLAYAYYLVLSQIAVFGIHMSVTKYVSEYYYDLEKSKYIFSTACCVALGLSLIVDLIVLLFLKNCNNLISDDLKQALLAILPALIFFSQNKIILGFANGLSRMRVYAVLQALRNIFIALSILILALLKINGAWITFCFSMAEFFLYIISLIYLLKEHLISFKISKKWIKEHLVFGFKILPANIVLELNTKIDVICLGIMSIDESLIGVYSFATLFVEGFYQVFVVIRRSLNPKITQLFNQKNKNVIFNDINKKIDKYLRLFSVPLVLMLTAGFSLICYIIGDNEYYKGIMPLFIIAVSIMANGKSIILGNMLSQSGFPSEESMINCVTAISNFMLNIVLIKMFGLLGAAIATAISYFVYMIILKKLVRKKLNYSI